jgi:protein ImuB
MGAQGFERIDFGWWDGTDSARDYYIARKRDDTLIWIFRLSRTGRWYLHGIFS